VNISEQNLSNFVDRTAPCIRDGVGYVYDFENHVIQAGAGITMVYDGDGNRVQKTVAGVTTKYLVDTQTTYYVYDGHGSVRALTKRSPRLASIPDGLRASRKLSVRPSHWYR
jgi:YD repeat-containing protein